MFSDFSSRNLAACTAVHVLSLLRFKTTHHWELWHCRQVYRLGDHTEALGCIPRLPSRSSGHCCSAQFLIWIFIQGIAYHVFLYHSVKRIQYNENKVTFSFVLVSVSCCLQAFKFHIHFSFFVYGWSNHWLIDHYVYLLGSVNLHQLLPSEN